MAAVFISHSSQDQAATERVAGRLRAAGFAALFVDFDPEQSIPAGRNWERELYAQLRLSDAVIFLASAASVASRWCFAELSQARSLGRPMFRCGCSRAWGCPCWPTCSGGNSPTPRRGSARPAHRVRGARLPAAPQVSPAPPRRSHRENDSLPP